MIPLFDSFALRPLRPEDASDIFRAIDTQRGYLGRWLPFVALTQSEEESRAFVAAARADPANPVYTLRAGDRFAGLIGFKSADPATRTIEIGYWLCEEYQHRGIVSAAVRELRRIAFEELDMRRIEIRCAAGNLPSNRIPQRLGMRLDRLEPQAEQLSSGERVDLNVYVSERQRPPE
ncbi:MAG: GNAT family N-acetyltransferase [Alistipes sp.]|nr:GNAT family N-acetyltransferase [Alistipes sp.]